LPAFLAYFGIACLTVAVLAISISRIPFGIGSTFAIIISVSFWLLVAKAGFAVLSVVLHSPFPSNP
jgi:hypothetical protein